MEISVLAVARCPLGDRDRKSRQKDLEKKRKETKDNVELSQM